MSTQPVERLQFTVRSLLIAVAIFATFGAAIAVVLASHRVLGWALVASALAALAYPLVQRLDRYMPRGVALLLVALGSIAFITFIGTAVARSLELEYDRLAEAAPRRAQEIEDSERFGDAANRIHLVERVKDFIDQVPQRLSGGTGAQAIRSTADRFLAFLVTGILTLFLIGHGPKIAKAGVEQLQDPRQRAIARRVVIAAYTRGCGYARGAVGLAFVAGFFGYVMARIGQVPGAAPLGLWVGLWSVIPIIGAFIGALPIVVLTYPSSPGRALFLALCFIGYQVVENLILHKRLEQRTFRLGPLVTALVGFIMLELFGIGGAAVGLFLASVLGGAMAELVRVEDEEEEALATQLAEDVTDPGLLDSS